VANDDQGTDLKYPESVRSTDEKRAWLGHQRDRWNAWSEALSRIKQDEQRWIRVGLTVYGALIALMTQAHRLFPDDRPWVSSYAFSAVVILVHFFAGVWWWQAMILRHQYYRTMARVYLQQARLGDARRIPDAWTNACSYHQWYIDETKPFESKLSEMLLLGLLTFAATAVAALLAFIDTVTLERECVTLFFAAMGWPILYLATDKWWMKAKVYDKPDAQELRGLQRPEQAHDRHRLAHWARWCAVALYLIFGVGWLMWCLFRHIRTT